MRLFLASRQVGGFLAALVAIGLVTFALGGSGFTLGSNVSAVPWATLSPALVAALLAICLAPPARALEIGAVRPLAPVRAATATGLIVCSVAALALASQHSSPPFGPGAVVRNMLGFAGVAALGSSVLPRAFAWAPISVVAIALLGLGAARPTPVYAWSVRPEDDSASWTIAGLLTVAGLVVYSVNLRYALSNRPEDTAD